MKSIKLKSGTELPLMDIRGKAYLQVAHRLVWFREERPDWSIETDLQRDKDCTFAKATIKNESGRIMATAHKFEDVKGFADHAEKAETGAIGRALALCGYGTQFEPDLDEGDRLADSPVGAKQLVAPEQPSPDGSDGLLQTTGYRIPFGKFKQRSIEEVYAMPGRTGKSALVEYIEYLENTAQKEGKEITGVVKEFIENADSYIAAIENAPIEPTWESLKD